MTSSVGNRTHMTEFCKNDKFHSLTLSATSTSSLRALLTKATRSIILSNVNLLAVGSMVAYSHICKWYNVYEVL